MLDMLKTTMEQIIASYAQYFGISMYFLLFLIASIYLYISEKEKNNFVLLIEYSLLNLFVIFNPLIAKWVIAAIDKKVYWRVFWIFPLTVVLAYTATTIVQKIKEKQGKMVVTIAFILIIVFSGKFIYTPDNFTAKTNWYKLPQETISICNILKNDSDDDIRVVVPPSLESTIRQYDADIYMVYGRDGGINSHYKDINERNALRNLMLGDVLNVPSIYSSMRYFDCNYLVVYNSTVLSENLGDYEFEYVESTDIYDIYRLNS